MTDITRLALQTQTDLQQQSNVEVDPSTYITLTRTATQALVTTGTDLNWQSAVRNRGFTWVAGTDITIPRTGYYHLDLTAAIGSNTSFSIDLYVSGIAVARLVNSTGGNNFRFMGTRYFTSGNVIKLRALVGANRTLALNAYGAIDESPFLHIVKV